MGKKIRNANCLFGTRYMLTQVEALQDEISGALVGDDIEHVHQMRVASRRLRNGLNLFKDCLSKKQAKTWRKEIRAITKALGNARDLDIQIDLVSRCLEAGLADRLKPGYNRLLLRLRQQRTLAQDKVDRTLVKLQEGDVLERMEKSLKDWTAGSENLYLYTPSLYQQAFEAISGALDEFLSYQEYIHDPDNIDELHAMRITGKHLRYTLEIFAPIYGHALDPHIQAMKDLQDLLGDIHDNDVWIAWLPEFIEEEKARIEDYFGHTGPLKRLRPGLNYFIEDRQRVRTEDYQTFLTTWETLQYENAWEVLNQIIKAPINIEAALAHQPQDRVEAPKAPQSRGEPIPLEEEPPAPQTQGLPEVSPPPDETDPDPQLDSQA